MSEILLCLSDFHFCHLGQRSYRGALSDRGWEFVVENWHDGFNFLWSLSGPSFLRSCMLIKVSTCKCFF